MAVDFWHRLLVTGSPAAVIAFRRAIIKVSRRQIGRKIWRETVPLSLAAICGIAPKAIRITGGIPSEPYDISSWSTKRLNLRRAQARYQFHTRNLEMLPYIRALARAFPKLEFILLTFCLDDGSIESFLIRSGIMRRWVMTERRYSLHWEAARRKFGLLGEAVYEHDEARFFAEQSALDEALDHWDKAAGRISLKRKWWNRQTKRDLDLEREILIAQLSNESNGTTTEE